LSATNHYLPNNGMRPPQTKVRLVRVAIVDDHPIVLDGLEYLFRKESGFEVVARCETAEEAVTAVLLRAPDILLLDVHMPGKNGIWVLEQIAGQSNTQVILLTAGVEERQIANALKLGARGILLKQRTKEDLITCIRDVRAGKRWIDEDVLQKVVRTITTTAGMPGIDVPLTKREFEVIQLVARGLRNKAIAEKLSVSDGTIKTHLRTIFRKLALNNRTELAIWARQNGFD
jgi:two-component system nitrate/nitrite response regulator NarL